jgi:hypothetical protein
MNILYGLILAFLSGLLINGESGIGDLIMSVACLGVAVIVSFWSDKKL